MCEEGSCALSLFPYITDCMNQKSLFGWGWITKNNASNSSPDCVGEIPDLSLSALAQSYSTFLVGDILNHDIPLWAKHPCISWVYTQSLSLEALPPPVKSLIARFWGTRIIDFGFAVVGKKNSDNSGIPHHQHTKDGEVYFGGHGNGTMKILNSEHVITEKPLWGHNFSVVLPWQSHLIEANPAWGELSFFYVKFMIGN